MFTNEQDKAINTVNIYGGCDEFTEAIAFLRSELERLNGSEKAVEKLIGFIVDKKDDCPPDIDNTARRQCSLNNDCVECWRKWAMEEKL
jgi:hypothetical protein